MNISPISFGRAIKVNAPDSVVDELIYSANRLVYRNMPPSPFDDFTHKIFCDVKSGERLALKHISPSGDVFILSGRDAHTKIIAEGIRDKKLNCNNNYLANLTNPEIYKRMSRYINQFNEEIINETDEYFDCLFENGENGSRYSEITLCEDAQGAKIVYFSSTEDVCEEMSMNIDLKI